MFCKELLAHCKRGIIWERVLWWLEVLGNFLGNFSFSMFNFLNEYFFDTLDPVFPVYILLSYPTNLVSFQKGNILYFITFGCWNLISEKYWVNPEKNNGKGNMYMYILTRLLEAKTIFISVCHTYHDASLHIITQLQILVLSSFVVPLPVSSD